MNLISLLAATANTDPKVIGQKACDTAGNGAIGCSGPNILAAGGFVTSAINVVLVISGIIAVLMVIIGGLRYTLSGGDSAGLKSAKDTIMYALIGLAIVLLAFAIVSYVVKGIG